MELQGGSLNQKSAINTTLGKLRLPALRVAFDQIDRYLDRFDTHCASLKWANEDWPPCLVNLI